MMEDQKREPIATIVVTYNRKELLLECIDALTKQSFGGFDILIIDNNSSDGTHDVIRPFIEDGTILYFNTGANLGGAGGFCYGIKKAVEMGYEYVWIMDDDSIPTPGALQRLVEAGEALRGNFGFLGSRVVWTDGSPCRMNVQRFSLTENLTEFKRELEPVVISSFVSMFISADTVKKVGLPIKEFFIWTDDWEYSRRISRSYPCYAVRESVVLHKTAVNSGADISRESDERLDRFRYAYRNGSDIRII